MEYTKGEKYYSEVTGEVYEYGRRILGLKEHAIIIEGSELIVTTKILEALKLVPYKKAGPEYLVGMFGLFSNDVQSKYGVLRNVLAHKFIDTLGARWQNFTPFDESLLKVNREWEALRDG